MIKQRIINKIQRLIQKALRVRQNHYTKKYKAILLGIAFFSLAATQFCTGDASQRKIPPRLDGSFLDKYLDNEDEAVEVVAVNDDLSNLFSPEQSPETASSAKLPSSHEQAPREELFGLAADRNKNSALILFSARENININPRDADGRTPLHIAATNGAKRNFVTLLHAGANPDLSDNYGNLPEECCQESVAGRWIGKLMELLRRTAREESTTISAALHGFLTKNLGNLDKIVGKEDWP